MREPAVETIRKRPLGGVEGGKELSPIFGDGLKDQAAAVWD
jgi:hypothetical protein